MTAALIGCALLAVSGCAGVSVQADDATVAAVRYRDPGPATLTVYSVINNRTGAGGHTALLINASERVLFDPAGSFRLDGVPERDDVLFGITPRVERIYRSAHARASHHVVSQTFQVTPEQAETAYRLALANGPVPGALCASVTSGLLRQVPGFENTLRTYFPEALMADLATRPDGISESYFENDTGDVVDGVAAAAL
ncbi:MAG: hypothetical protein NXH82_00250 [Rhodobacteraceae bacterium]|nr:hypothetical protein [Paracoccaceae bacterium]